MTEFAPGEFYGNVRERVSSPGAVFSSLSHGTGGRLPRHAHSAAFFSLLIRGGYRERFNRTEIDYAPLTLVFHSPGLVHSDEIGDGGATFFTMEFDARWWDVLGMRRPDAAFGSSHPDLLGQTLALYRHQARGTLGPLEIENAAVELLGDAMRLPASEERSTPRWLGRVVDRLEAEAMDGVTVGALAREADVHPVHLTRVFRKRYEMSIPRYVRRKRISEAIRMLGCSETSISEIAHATGFSDHAHFCRLFRLQTGLTPGEARQMLRGASRAGAGSPHATYELSLSPRSRGEGDARHPRRR